MWQFANTVELKTSRQLLNTLVMEQIAIRNSTGVSPSGTTALKTSIPELPFLCIITDSFEEKRYPY